MQRGLVTLGLEALPTHQLWLVGPNCKFLNSKDLAVGPLIFLIMPSPGPGQHRLLDEWWMDGWRGGWVDGWMDGWMDDAWMDGWMDG